MSRAVELAERVLATVPAGVDADVRVEVGTAALTRFANSFIHQNVAEEAVSVVLRVALDGRVAMASTTNATAAALEAFVAAAVEAASLRPVDPDWPGPTPPTAVPAVEHWDEATADADPRERAEKVRAFVAAGAGMLGAGYCETAGGEVAFADTAGHHAAGRSSRAVFDGIHQTADSAGSGHAASASLGEIDAGALGREAAARARDATTPVDLEPGRYEVVLGPEAVATIVVFLAAYGFNAKMVQEGRSFVELGVTRFDERFSLWDDALDDRALGLPFDAEGTPKRRVDLVRDGTAVGLAHDRRTAAKAGTESTGHAAPGSESFGPFPTNLFVGRGDRDVPELLAGVERGLYVATFNYCRVLDPKSLSVTGLTRNGTFLVEGGEISRAVTDLRFTQSFVEALGPGRVLAVGDDARLADSEFGTGIAHVPSLRLAEWHFTGGAEG